MKAALCLVLASVAGTLAGSVVAGCDSASPAHHARQTPTAASTSGVPAPAPASRPPSTAPTAAPARTVIVMMENLSYGEIIGNPAAPFLNRLAARGALFTNSHAVAHPSEPNYLALFSGSTHGITSDACPLRFTGPSLAAELIAAGHTFAGYAESLPASGAATCSAGEYARRHVPWVNFTSLPASASRPLSAFPTADFSALPTLSFVIPNLCHDMHDCPVGTGDAWLRAHIGPYAAWAMTHNSLLIVDWDENDGSPGNQIPTIFAGQHVRPGRYGRAITHYGVLRTIEDLYRLPPLGQARTAHPVTGIWK